MAPLREHILLKSSVSQGLLAQVVRVPRTTQSTWMNSLNLALQPLMNLMDEQLRSSRAAPGLYKVNGNKSPKVPTYARPLSRNRPVTQNPARLGEALG